MKVSSCETCGRKVVQEIPEPSDEEIDEALRQYKIRNPYEHIYLYYQRLAEDRYLYPNLSVEERKNRRELVKIEHDRIVKKYGSIENVNAELRSFQNEDQT